MNVGMRVRGGLLATLILFAMPVAGTLAVLLVPSVAVAQTVGLVQLLRQKNVPYELIVVPDDTHETMIHDRWMYLWDRMEAFLKKYVRDKAAVTSTGGIP